MIPKVMICRTMIDYLMCGHTVPDTHEKATCDLCSAKIVLSPEAVAILAEAKAAGQHAFKFCNACGMKAAEYPKQLEIGVTKTCAEQIEHSENAKAEADRRPGRTFKRSDGTHGCDECCTMMIPQIPCDHYHRDSCPYCLGTGTNATRKCAACGADLPWTDEPFPCGYSWPCMETKTLDQLAEETAKAANS